MGCMAEGLEASPEQWDKMTGFVADLEALYAEGRLERDKRKAAGEDIGFYEDALAKLAENVAGMRDLITMHRFFEFAKIHGTGPYTLEELSALTETEPSKMQRVIDQLVTDGILFLD